MTFSQLQLVPRWIQQPLQRDLPGFNPANPLVREEQRKERQDTLGQCTKQSSSKARFILSVKVRSGSKRVPMKCCQQVKQLCFEPGVCGVSLLGSSSAAVSGGMGRGRQGMSGATGTWRRAESCWEMVTDLKACKCGEHRFATHEDRFLERRLLEGREELALQAVLGMLLWPPGKWRGGMQECRALVMQQLQSKPLLIILGTVPADQQHRAAQPPAETSDEVLLLFCCTWALHPCCWTKSVKNMCVCVSVCMACVWVCCCSVEGEFS